MNAVVVSRLLKDRNEMAIHANLSEETALEDGGLVCPYVKCGRAVSEPVRLTNLSRGSKVETYYACPYCFSKLNIDEVSENYDFGVKKGKTVRKDADVKPDKPFKASECTHHMGYLKNRPPNATIPDECLTCSKILQCMVQL